MVKRVKVEIMQDLFRVIPSVNEILESQEASDLIHSYGRGRVKEVIQEIIQEYRESISSESEIHGYIPSREDMKADFIRRLVELIQKNAAPGLKRVINATGIIIHTNLGRAPMPAEALDAVYEVSRGYSNLEYDLDNGSRGSRHDHIEALLTCITGAESAMVVNNNAAAVFLSLNTIAMGREVIVSRGQQVEIGGSFRIPDIIAGCGAKMVEIGTTNKTHLKDYESAITESTSVLLKVHTSNFRIIGFTEQVELVDMVSVGRKHGICVMEDLGSGSLIDLSPFGLPREPTVQDSIRRGADLVTFSGDKLLGGPQAGIIAGRRDLIDKIKSNPLARMVRCDKMTIAALAATIRLYMEPEKAADKIPVLKMMSRNEQQLEVEAQELRSAIAEAVNDKSEVKVIDEYDEAGGGSLPGVVMKGKAVALTPAAGNANILQILLRKCSPAIICTVKGDSLLLSVRTLMREDFHEIADCLRKVLREL